VTRHIPGPGGVMTREILSVDLLKGLPALSPSPRELCTEACKS
jgi:hypothetical protein